MVNTPPELLVYDPFTVKFPVTDIVPLLLIPPVILGFVVESGIVHPLFIVKTLTPLLIPLMPLKTAELQVKLASCDVFVKDIRPEL
jgi:hypothetical protein